MRKIILSALVLGGGLALTAFHLLYLGAAYLVHRAEQEEKRGRIEEALRYYEQARRLLPAKAEYHRAACRLYLIQYQPGSLNHRPLYQAKEACARALEADPAYPYHWYEMGVVLMTFFSAGVRNEPTPEPYVERGLAIDPANPRFLAGWLSWLLLQNRREEAWQIFVRLLLVQPRAVEVFGASLLQSEEDLARLTKEVEDADAPSVNLAVARFLFSQMKYDEALFVIRRIPSEYWHEISVAALLTELLALNGELDEAQRVLSSALSVHPESLDLAWQKGRLLERKGDKEGALAAYLAAVRLQPNRPDLHLTIAALAEKLGRDDLAIEHYHEAASAETLPSSKKKELFLKIGALKEKKLDLDGAWGEYRRALDFAPDDSEIHHRLEVIRIKKKYLETGLPLP